MGRSNSSGAGDYWGKVTHYRHFVTVNPSNNQKVDDWANNGNLWCYVTEMKSKEEPHYGASNHVVEAEIHLRHYPDVGPKDRFKDLYRDRVYQVKGIIFDFNAGETVVQAYQVPSRGEPVDIGGVALGGKARVQFVRGA